MAATESPPPINVKAPLSAVAFAKAAATAFVPSQSGHFKHAHGAVPEHRLAGQHRIDKACGGFGTDVEAHPVRRNGVGGDDLGVGIWRKRIGAQRIGRQEQFRTAGLGLLEMAKACACISARPAGADGAALRLHECVGHAAAHDQAVHAADEVLDDAELELTLAPPMMAVKGFSGWPRPCPTHRFRPPTACRRPCLPGKTSAMTAVEAWARWAVPNASLM